jgi:hypothetical protein
VGATLAAHTSGSADRSRDLWMLLNTHLWWGLFVEGGESLAAISNQKSDISVPLATGPISL